MKTSPALLKALPLLAVVSLLLLTPAALLAQGVLPATSADQFAGKYKGTAKTTTATFDLKLEIKNENGKLLGSLVTPKGEQTFAAGEILNGKLRFRFGAPGAPELLTLELRDGKLLGDWKVAKENRAVALERVVVAVTAPPTPDLLSGEWEAAADAQGQAIPFNLILKLDGEKVTGSSSSHLGDSTISSGSWKDGKLAVVLDSGGGPIALVGTMVDGKLAGDFDYNGQLQGKWVATRKKQ